jgi:glycosyltransferase involved in cell wall biosynthesis
VQPPVYLLGDGWGVPSGLGRIARDLSAVLELPQIGYHPPATVVRGGENQYSFSHLDTDYGAATVVEWLAGRHDPQLPGVLCVIWDPSRAFHYLAPMRRYLPEWQLWGYFAVDGHDINGSLSGSLAEAVQKFDRVTAYTKYGADILRPLHDKPVSYLPHGISIERGYYQEEAQLEVVRRRLIPRFDGPSGDWLVGCVATNQPRKDLHLFVETIAKLRAEGQRVWGWLHTDTVYRHWSVPELLNVHKVSKWIRVTVGVLPDSELHQLYAACRATICVGRGEGFGYPIVESLGCGTPCLAIAYAGGAELTPPQWRYPYHALAYDNVYGIGRPIASADSLVGMLYQIAASDRDELRAYCRGAVRYLHWDYLARRWQTWLKKGLEAL